jgi:hypothetical protein
MDPDNYRDYLLPASHYNKSCDPYLKYTQKGYSWPIRFSLLTISSLGGAGLGCTGTFLNFREDKPGSVLEIWGISSVAPENRLTDLLFIQWQLLRVQLMYLRR